MRRRRYAIAAHGHASCFGDLLGYLASRQYAAMARLGPLAELDLHHLDLGIARVIGELRRVELAVIGSAPEIAATDLPDQISPVRAVVAGNAAFTGVVVEISGRRALVERHDRIGRE